MPQGRALRKDTENKGRKSLTEVAGLTDCGVPTNVRFSAGLSDNFSLSARRQRFSPGPCSCFRHPISRCSRAPEGKLPALSNSPDALRQGPRSWPCCRRVENHSRFGPRPTAYTRGGPPVVVLSSDHSCDTQTG